VAKGSLTSFNCNFASNGFSVTASWVLGPGSDQVTEYSVSGGASTWVHTNAFTGGKIEATYLGTGTYFYLGDWLGTKRVEVGTNGCLANFASLPYGNGLSASTPAGYAACPDATEQHFTGKERDTESGNDYFEARYYSSAIGRFMSPDWSAKLEPVPYAVLVDPQSLNLYAYVRNNPLSSVDPDGHWNCTGENASGSACQAMAEIHAANGLVLNDAGKLVDQATNALHKADKAIGSVSDWMIDHPVITAVGMIGMNPGADESAEPAIEEEGQELETSVASVEDKLSRYLLNPDHKGGGAEKAIWFEKALGFTKSNMDKLTGQIRFDPKTAVQTGVNQWGTKFNQVININGANGRTIPVTFAWIVHSGETAAQLITGIPTGK